MQRGAQWQMREKLVKFVHALDSVSRWSGRIFMYLTLVLCFLLTTTAVARYVFQHPLDEAADLVVIVFGALFPLIGGYVLLVHAHVSMDILRNRMSLRAGAILDSITWLLLLAFVGVVVWQGSEIGWRAIVSGQRLLSGWQPVLWPMRVAIPIGAAILLFQAIAEYTRTLYTAITGRRLE